MLIEGSRYLTKEEFAQVIHTDVNSMLFDRLGDNPIIMRCPRSSLKDPIWYHVSDRENYYGNFEVKEDIHEVWVDSKVIAHDFGLAPRRYGFWFLWKKF